MSASISGSAIGTYLAIVKDEPTAVAQAEKTDAATQAAVGRLQKQAPTITSPTGLLDNYASLQVILGATGLSSSIGQTALLKDLLTQDPGASTSLVQKTANTQYLAFAQAMEARPSVQFQLGATANLSVATGGAGASTFTVQNAAYAADPSTTSASNVAQQFSFVLNDGSANASVAAALAAAAGGSASYTILPGGSVSASAGAPPVVTTTDASGNEVYSMALAVDSTGTPTTMISVVSVAVPTAQAVGATAQVARLVTAMQNQGLDATLQSNGSLNVIGATLDRTGLPVFSAKATIPTSTTSTILAMGAAASVLTAGQLIVDGTTVIGQVSSVDAHGNVTLAGNARAAVAAGDTLTAYNGLAVSTTATAATTTSATVIAMGSAGLDLVPGQILRNGNRVLGTIASIDATGHVTLTAAAQTTVAIGDRLDVEAGASMSGAGLLGVATQSAAAGSTALQLGVNATKFSAGQLLVSGSTVIGTIAGVDPLGRVTLTAPSLAAVSAGATVVAVPPLVGATVQALSDPQNLTSLINQYKTNQYEAAQGKQNLGMTQALYYHRKIGAVTSIDQLMSDPILLSVVEANLGLPTAFGELSFDQQKATLTKDVVLSKFQDASYVKSSAERYLSLVQQNNPAQNTDSSGLLALLSGTDTDPADSILTLLDAGDTTATLPATSGGDSSASSILSLFA